MSEVKETQITIDLPEDMIDGVYSNLVVVNNSDYEFVLDFINVMPATPKARVKARVILSPNHAKNLLNILAHNIRVYEEKNGEIKEHGGVSIPMNMKSFGEA